MHLRWENQTVRFGLVNNYRSCKYAYIYNVLIGGEPPYDGYPEERIDQNHIALIIVYNLAAACGLVFVVACFIFNVVFRKRK